MSEGQWSPAAVQVHDRLGGRDSLRDSWAGSSSGTPLGSPLYPQGLQREVVYPPPTLSLYSSGQRLKLVNDFGSLRLGPCWVRPGLGPVGPSGTLELSVYLLPPCRGEALSREDICSMPPLLQLPGEPQDTAMGATVGVPPRSRSPQGDEFQASQTKDEAYRRLRCKAGPAALESWSRGYSQG